MPHFPGWFVAICILLPIANAICEICWNLNCYVISCVRVALCRPGAFAFLWDCFGPCWPEVIPRCRSPPPLFRSLVNHQPKRRSIWLLSICGTTTRFIHRIVSLKYRTKLLKCSKNLTAKRLPTGCVQRAGCERGQGQVHKRPDTCYRSP